MSTESSPTFGWRLVATVEISNRAPSLKSLLDGVGQAFDLQPASKSPPGFSWFDLSIDSSLPERRTAAIARALLAAMAERSRCGQLDGFRIIAGQHWLEVKTNWASRRDSDKALDGGLPNLSCR
jgi:hypothetical protein